MNETLTDAQATEMAMGTEALTPPAIVGARFSAHRTDLATLADADRARMVQVVKANPSLDGQMINAFGSDAQRNANRYLDELLQHVSTKDTGRAGDILAEVAQQVKLLDIPGLRNEAMGRPTVARVLSKVPVLGRQLFKGMSAFERFRQRHRQVVDHFNKIETDARNEMARITGMDSKLDKLVAVNLASLSDLRIHLLAGQVVLEREARRYSAMREEALAGQDPIVLAQVRDFGEQINAFESRLLRIHAAMTDALLSVPQTRLTQSAGRIEYRNIMDTLLFDMPRLKSAVLRIAALKQINDASKASEARRKLVQSMSEAGVVALDRAYIRAKESEGGALAEIAKLGDAADRIIGLIDKGSQIDERNREERDRAHQQLDEVRNKFTQGLSEAVGRSVEQGRH